MYLKNLCLRFRLVKICNKKLCSPPQERTVAHASGSESSVLFPWLMLPLGLHSVSLLLSFPCNSVANASACSFFRASASVFSVKFRVNPWLYFCLLPCFASAYFRVIPWQMLLLILPSVANLLLRNPCIIKKLQYRWLFAICRV